MLLRTLLATALLFPATAWFDHGHMLVAYIGKLMGPQGFEEKMQRIFMTNEEFTNFTTIHDAAVWLDHVQCSPDQMAWKPGGAPYCAGLAKPASLQMYRSWHYFNWNYDPNTWQHGDEMQVPSYDGSPYDVMYKAATGMMMKEGANSPYSWAMAMYLLLHIWGDMHQPLHMGSYYNPEMYPQGDNTDVGGSALNIFGEYAAVAKALHQLWDGVAGKYPLSYPIPDESLRKSAWRLIKNYPAKDFVAAGRLPEDWAAPNCSDPHLIEDTMLSAISDTKALHPMAYQAWLERNLVEPKYDPEPSYVRWLKRTARSQIALGGYRLSSILRCVAPNVPVLHEQLAPEHLAAAPFPYLKLSKMAPILHQQPPPGCAPYEELVLDDAAPFPETDADDHDLLPPGWAAENCPPADDEVAPVKIVKPSAAKAEKLEEQIARLLRENAQLKQQAATLQQGAALRATASRVRHAHEQEGDDGAFLQLPVGPLEFEQTSTEL